MTGRALILPEGGTIQMSAPTRVILSGIFLLALVLGTAFAQLSYHFNTYVALGIMVIGTFLVAAFLFNHHE
jgi:hypothetical protein